MKSYGSNAMWAGAFFLAAMVSSLVGGGLIESSIAGLPNPESVASAKLPLVIPVVLKFILVLPIILNEIYLGIRLIVKGFSSESVTETAA